VGLGSSGLGAVMAALQGFHHVKLPVSDLVVSREWYERVLGLTVAIEFVEDGRVMGVAMSDPGGTVDLALRYAPERAAALAGFDPVAIGVPSSEEVTAWRDRLDELGVAHGGIVSGHFGASLLVGLHDPDGIEIRLYALDGPRGEQ
jgi:catechol 2,3-dioxygenase-like lactoylglutathione lyase family enzyme